MTIRWRLALAVLPAAFVAVFFFYPVGSIIALGLGAGEGAFGVLRDALIDPSLRRAAWFTSWQAGVSTLLTLILGFPAAYVFGRYDFRGKAALRAAITIPFVMPTVVVAAAFLTLLGPSGPLGLDLGRGIFAILVAHVFYNYAVVVRTVGSALERLDPRLEAVARTLGATWWQAFRRVTLPLLMPSVLAAASLVFLFTFTSFGVVLILGGLEYSTLEVTIWRATTQRLDLAFAAVVALVQMAGVGFALWMLARAQHRRTFEIPIAGAQQARTKPGAPAERWAVRAVVGFSIALLGLPLAVLVWRSFTLNGAFSLANYAALLTRNPRGLFVPPAESIGNSLVFAVPATLIALTMGLLAAAFLARRTDRPAGQPGHHPAGTRARGDAACGAGDHTGAALDPGAAAGSRRSARGLAPHGLADGGPADRDPSGGRGRWVRIRRLPRRVRGHVVHRASQHDHHPHPHLPAPLPAGVGQLRRSDGDGGGAGDPHRPAHHGGGSGPRRRSLQVMGRSVGRHWRHNE